MSDPREPQQRCGTCRWWNDRASGRPCRWEPPEPADSYCVVDYVRSWTLTDDGQTCPTWALRTTNKEQNHD